MPAITADDQENDQLAPPGSETTFFRRTDRLTISAG